MLLTAGLVALGLFALLSIIMMIGNVFKRGAYGRVWALIGFFSVLFAGVLLLLQVIAPQVRETMGADHEVEKTAEAADLEPHGEEGAETPESDPLVELINGGQKVTAANPSSGSVSGLDDLTVLSNVFDFLKDGKELPAEYLAMLPDGGQSFLAIQGGSDSSSLSKPLQTQLVSMQRSEGKTQHAGTSYVPTKPSPAPAPSGSGTKTPSSTPAPAPSGGASEPAPSEGTGTDQNPAGGDSAEPATPPPPAQQPAPTPPPVTPPAQTGPSLLDGGLLKPLLGKSKSQAEAHMQYSQSLGASGNTYRYLHGVTIVELTYSGDTVTRVKLQFNQFTPSGQTVGFYEDYMRGIAGMSNAEAASRNGGDITWRKYPGASQIKFHIDTRSNFGYVEATR